MKRQLQVGRSEAGSRGVVYIYIYIFSKRPKPLGGSRAREGCWLICWQAGWLLGLGG